VTTRDWPADTIVAPLPFGSVKRPDSAALSAEASGSVIEFKEVFHRELHQKVTADA
jgi:hypothetical protein